MIEKNARGQLVFRALADPNRRKILKLLQGGSQSAGELAEAFPITKGSLSHHFNVLKAADLVRTERRGQSIVYSLNTSVFEDVAGVLLELLGVTSSGPPKAAAAYSKLPSGRTVVGARLSGGRR